LAKAAIKPSDNRMVTIGSRPVAGRPRRFAATAFGMAGPDTKKRHDEEGRQRLGSEPSSPEREAGGMGETS
jgi:hypothetical protein